jgi:hypothetical protein
LEVAAQHRRLEEAEENMAVPGRAACMGMRRRALRAGEDEREGETERGSMRWQRCLAMLGGRSWD